MANVYAVKSGNWSDTTVWNTGALPTAADDVFANNFTVTCDTTTSVLSIRNTSAAGIAAGGSFAAVNGITLTATATDGIISGSSACYISNLTTGQSSTIVGNGAQTVQNFIAAVLNNSTGTLNAIGNFRGTGLGALNNSTGTLNITGNVTGTGSWHAVYNNTTGTINITGFVTGNTAVTNISTGTVNITGNVTSTAGNCVLNSAGGTITITGNVTGGTNGTGVSNNSSGTINHVGSVIAGTGGAGFAYGSTAQITILTGPLISTSATEGGAAASGVNPCAAARWFPADTALTTFRYTMRGQTVSGGARPARDLYLSNAYDALYPTPANVRSGVTYGPGSIVGTCAVPPAGSVSLGVPVDATTGTAAITGDSIRAAVGLSSANLDTQLSGIPAAIRSNLATELGRIDTAISTRLEASGYTAPPSAATNASAVRSELSTELGRIDTTISSRLPASSYQEPLDATEIRSALGLSSANLDTQLDAIPTAAENASAVRTELTTELSRVDATVSSRLADADYVNPPTDSDIRSAIGLSSANLDTQLDALPTATENASATRTELSTELARIDTTVSSRLAPDGTLARVTLTDTTTTLTNAPDVPTPEEIAGAVRTELATELGRIDVSTSTRLAEVDYIDPPTDSDIRAAIGLSSANLDTQLDNLPTAIENASAVRTELSTELSRIDTSISSRLSPDGTLARVTLTDTTTTLTNAPDVPTPEEISEAVWTETERTVTGGTIDNLTNPPIVPTPEQISEAVREELQPELNQMDAPVSSRLAAENYTEPLSPEQTREAIGLEEPNLDQQLFRKASVDQVAQIVEDSSNA